MMTINDLVEDWIEVRSKLQHQLKAIESGQLQTDASGVATEATRLRLKKWIDELNALLKEYSSAGVKT